MKIAAYRPKVALAALILAGTCVGAAIQPQTAFAQGFSNLPETVPVASGDVLSVQREVEGVASVVEGASDDLAADEEQVRNEALTAPDAVEDDGEGGVAEEGGDATASDESAAAHVESAESDPVGSLAGDDVLAVKNGTYVIESGTADAQVLDVASNGSTPGSNVQTYTYNGSNAQKWDIAYEEESGGYYVAKHGTDLVLEVKGGNAKNKVNIQLGRKTAGLASQLWDVVQNGLAYTFVSLLDENYVLDLSDAGKKNGTNVDIYESNGTNAQKFYLLPTNLDVESNVVLEDGAYEVLANVGTNKSVDISGASLNSGANAQTWDANGSGAQRFFIHRESDGFYVISVVGTGKVLDVSGGQFMPGGNIQQWTYNGTDAQKWAICENEDGSYTFINKANGLVMDVAGASTANGGNLNTYRSNGSAAQKFTMNKIDAFADGIYTIKNFVSLNSKVVDIKNGSSSSGAQAQLYSGNDSFAQRYQVVNNDDGTISIRTAASGGWLTPASSGLVVQSGSSQSVLDANKKWVLEWNGSFFSLVNVGATASAGKSQAMDIEGASTSNGARVQVYSANGTDAQHFLLSPSRLLKDGAYKISSALGKVLDISGGSTANGANVQGYADNESAAQKYYVTYSNGGYVITNIVSGKVLDVASGSLVSGANVRMWDKNGTSAQIWDVEIADGGNIIFLNRKSGMALNLTGSLDGSNVNQVTADGSENQSWHLANAIVSTWANEAGKYYYYDANGARSEWSYITYRAWEQVRHLNSRTQYAIAIDNTSCHTVIFTRSNGGWAPLHDWVCSVGNDTLGRTFRGVSYTSGAKGYVMGNDPDYFYWTTFRENSEGGQRFHSIAYYRPNGGGIRSEHAAVYDGRLGQKITHGCVRLPLEKVMWIFNNVNAGTVVRSYD